MHADEWFYFAVLPNIPIEDISSKQKIVTFKWIFLNQIRLFLFVFGADKI